MCIRDRSIVDGQVGRDAPCTRQASASHNTAPELCPLQTAMHLSPSWCVQGDTTACNVTLPMQPMCLEGEKRLCMKLPKCVSFVSTFVTDDICMRVLQGPTRTARSSSSAPWRQAGWMASTWCLERLWTAWTPSPRSLARPQALWTSLHHHVSSRNAVRCRTLIHITGSPVAAGVLNSRVAWYLWYPPTSFLAHLSRLPVGCRAFLCKGLSSSSGGDQVVC